MIKLVNVKKTFGKKESMIQALRGIDLTVQEGEMIAVMGKSGSGKSTLLNILGALISMDCGEYHYRGQLLDFKNQAALTAFRRDHIGFIVQYFALIEDMTVFENVAMALRYQRKSNKEIRQRLMSTLDTLELSDKIRAYPDELSGGQQQRVSIARAIVKNPDIILADEPTGALDEETEESVMAVFNSIHKTGKTMVIVTHDDRVAQRCQQVVHLRDGLMV